MSQEPAALDPVVIGKQLHKGRVYLALAAFMFVGLVVVRHLADDAILAARNQDEISHRLGEVLIHQEFKRNLAVVGPLGLALLAGAALLVWRRAWWFVLSAAFLCLVFSCVLFCLLMLEYTFFQTVLRDQEWFPGRRQWNDFNWLKIGALGLTTFVGFISSLIVLDILCRYDVEQAYRYRELPAPTDTDGAAISEAKDQPDA
jgi:hypothetical protein